MPRFESLVLGGLVLAVLSGCGAPVIDSSSIGSLERSIGALREPLEPTSRQLFDESLSYLVDGASLADAASDPGLVPQVLSLFKRVEGLDAETVLARALAERTGEVQGAIAKLEKLRDGSAEARDVLDKVELSEARIFKRNKGFLRWPVIELEVANGTTNALSLVRLRATLLAAEDPEPWMQEDLDKLLVETLGPGARTTWRLEPEQGEWVKLIDPHPNVRFSLEVIALLAPGGRELASTEWTAVEQHRLRHYRETLEVILQTGALALDRPPRPAKPPYTVATPGTGP